MKVPRVLVLLALVASCRGLGTPAGVAQAERQLKAAAESTSDVLDLARRDAPELVRALEAVQIALEEASRELAREGRIDTLEEVLALVESTILLSADQPRIGLALVTLKAALLQLKAASP